MWNELFEQWDNETQLLDMWDLLHHFGVDDVKDRFHDDALPWINRNSVSKLTRLTRNKKLRLLSKLMYWQDHICHERNWGKPFATPEAFKAALVQPITIWRGGGGVYDPNFGQYEGADRDWVSFTASERRLTTFTKYDGTRASSAYSLRQRSGAWWVIELTIPLNEILLYLPQGFDDEVIVSKHTAREARVIRTNAEASS